MPNATNKKYSTNGIVFFFFISDLIDKRNKIARKEQEIYSKY